MKKTALHPFSSSANWRLKKPKRRKFYVFLVLRGEKKYGGLPPCFAAERKFIFRRTVRAPLEAYSSSTHKVKKMPYEKGIFFFYIKKECKNFFKNSGIRFFFFIIEEKKRKEKKRPFWKKRPFLKNFLSSRKEIFQKGEKKVDFGFFFTKTKNERGITERYHEVKLPQGTLSARVVGLEQPSKHGYLH